MFDFDRAIDAYRAMEPRRHRNPFADRALRDRLAAIGASRESRRGVRGRAAAWFAAIPRRALASGALSIAILFVGLSGTGVGAPGGDPNGAAADVSNLSATKSSEMVRTPPPAAFAPGGAPSEALDDSTGVWGAGRASSLFVVLGLAGVIGSLLTAEIVRRRRRG